MSTQLAAPYSDLIKRLAAIRKARGISQCELSEMIGLDRGHISKYEAGFKTPKNLFILVCWCEALGVAIDFRQKTGATRPRRPVQQMAFPWPVARPRLLKDPAHAA